MFGRMRMLALILALAIAGPAGAQSFVNFESPHAHPMAMTPDEGLLLAVNTPDARLEVFTLAGPTPVRLASVPVGLEPVSVRARSATEAWVVNHLSDSISVVDLATLRVVRTIRTGDEPSDVVFAGSPQRAFVTCSQSNTVEVHDPDNPQAPPTILTLGAEEPRALATDGARVFAAIFDSGNRTTILPQQVVSEEDNPYQGDPNPPPNSGGAFSPAQNPANPDPPEVGLIVRKDAQGAWRDDNGADWSDAVTWDVVDRDVAIINAQSLAITYAGGLMHQNMALALRPDGRIGVVGTDATNEVRFEPNLNGVFLRVLGATVDPLNPGASTVVDLNPHLDYAQPTVTQALRDQSLGDPRAVVFDGAGRAFVAGMGSNDIAIFDAAMARIGRIEVGDGPTGLALRESAGHLYALNRFDGSISVVSTALLQEVARVAFFDPTPQPLKEGRRFLFDTHLTSGLGHTSCASCHTDGATDGLVWDLGDPAGLMKPFNQTCSGGVGDGCEDWHPMKGPLATQTLIGIVGNGPMHWRGDREDLGAFNTAFQTILGDDAVLTPQEMALFEQYLASRRFPPNPFRNLDNSLSGPFASGGDPLAGRALFTNAPITAGTFACTFCHALPTGTNTTITSASAIFETQSLKIPHLRNLFEKTGFDTASAQSRRGFGFIKDGSVPSLVAFLERPEFDFSGGATGNQERRDLEAFLLSFDTGTHAAVGQQVFIESISSAGATDQDRLDDLIALAGSNAIGLVAHQKRNGVTRGYAYIAGQFQSDRTGESYLPFQLAALAQPGSEVLYTAVPKGSEIRLGLDRDGDGHWSYDEILACADPADPDSVPGSAQAADLDASGEVNGADLGILLGAWGTADADLTGDGTTDGADLGVLLGAWGSCG
jgi:YVTN family beta-propeller protein